MGYMFYSLTFFFLVTATILFFTRNLWKPYAPPIPYLTAPGTIPEPIYNLSANVTNYIDSFRYSRVPSTFQEDAEAGLHSSNFSLAENIEGEDSRSGLDDHGKREVYRIMRQRNVDFDEGRRLWMNERFSKAQIGEDGRPLDRKAVMFS